MLIHSNRSIHLNRFCIENHLHQTRTLIYDHLKFSQNAKPSHKTVKALNQCLTNDCKFHQFFGSFFLLKIQNRIFFLTQKDRSVELFGQFYFFRYHPTENN